MAKKYTFVQHVPRCVDLGKNPVMADFNTLRELLSIPFVKGFCEDENFYRYSLSENLLMEESHEGEKWWVIGTIYGGDPTELGLPNWEPNEDKEGMDYD